MRWLLAAGIASPISGCGASGGIGHVAYPSAWHAHSCAIRFSFSTSIVDLSPQRLQLPCITRHGTHNTTITCRQAIAHLQPGSMLMSWSIFAVVERLAGGPATVGEATGGFGVSKPAISKHLKCAGG